MSLASGVDVPDWAKAAGLLAATVALAGVADFALTRAGYEALAALAWAAGYGGAVVVVWAVWLRDMEFEPGG
ncbi:hypothetical protein [Halorarius halobius]|uniref:hypothetical protein n=1 Tax=Halorarius halobius TaxID=2962671 RepID=UPI0020CC9377|nr:hypothetical protein [Halorarius halobius]